MVVQFEADYDEALSSGPSFSPPQCNSCADRREIGAESEVLGATIARVIRNGIKTRTDALESVLDAVNFSHQRHRNVPNFCGVR
jgi:hypothetical protein